MVSPRSLQRVWLLLPRAGSVLYACITISLLPIWCARAFGDDLLRIVRPAAPVPRGSSVASKVALGSQLFPSQAALGPAVPRSLAELRLATAGERTPFQSFHVNSTPADAKVSAARIFADKTTQPEPTTRDAPDAASDPVATGGFARENGSTRVNFLTGVGTASGLHYAPLTGEQRWKYYINQNFTSLGAVAGPLVTSLGDQAFGTPEQWGGGMEGYGKRFASRLGTGIIQGTVQSAGCAILGQEPRYISSTSTKVSSRVGHAILYTFVTYNNEGKKRVAIAALVSYYAAGMATTLWLPGHHTILGDGVRDGSRKVALAALVNEWQEFWPMIRRYLRLGS